MRTLSTDSAHGDGSPHAIDVAGRLVGAILPAIVAATLGGALLFGDVAEVHEIRAMAPAEASPDAPLPVRAVVFAGEDDVGSAPLDAEIAAWFEDGRSPGAKVTLRRSLVLGSEGELVVPATAPPDLTLVVEAALPGGARARAARRVRVREDAARPPHRARPRTDLERLTLGPVVAMGEAAPPGRLDLEVPAGSCVPELPCRLRITSEPRHDVSVEAAPNVEVRGRAGNEATVVVRGPEGVVTLVASRDGAVVARREARLPLVSGAIAVEVRRARVATGESPSVFAWSLEDGPLALDLFRDGRWVRATSVRARAGRAMLLPLGRLGEGEYRVQVQRHLFAEGSADRAGVGLFRVLGGDEADADGAPSGDEVIAPPATFGGASGTRGELARSRARVRQVAALVALLSGVLGSALLLRRGAFAPRAELFGYALLVFTAFGAVAAFAWAVP